jgi:hypothetical protein
MRVCINTLHKGDCIFTNNNNNNNRGGGGSSSSSSSKLGSVMSYD